MSWPISPPGSSTRFWWWTAVRPTERPKSGRAWERESFATTARIRPGLPDRTGSRQFAGRSRIPGRRLSAIGRRNCRLLASRSPRGGRHRLGSRLAGRALPARCPGTRCSLGNRLAARLIRFCSGRGSPISARSARRARTSSARLALEEDHLWMGGRDDSERRSAGLSDCRSAGELLSAHREIEYQRHSSRHDGAAWFIFSRIFRAITVAAAQEARAGAAKCP